MAKIDKHFLNSSSSYNYKDKEKNKINAIALMFNRTSSMFIYENLPPTIPPKELELLLQSKGFGIVTEIEGDLYIVSGGLGGVVDVYNRPTQAIISIPYFNYNETLEIGEDCILVKNDTTSTGLKPIFEKYINLLDENEISMLMATVNNRIQTLISANDDNTVVSANEFLDKTFKGELGVIAEQQLFDSLKVNNTRGSSTGITDLINLQQYLKGSMYNEIGLSANYNMKKERLINAEVEQNNDVLYPLIDDMLDCRLEAIEKINEKYNLDIKVKFGSSWVYRNVGEQELETTDETIIETTDETIIETTDETIDDVEDLGGTDEEKEPTNTDDRVEDEEPLNEFVEGEKIEELKEDIEEIEEDIEGLEKIIEDIEEKEDDLNE